MTNDGKAPKQWKGTRPNRLKDSAFVVIGVLVLLLVMFVVFAAKTFMKVWSF